MLTKDRRRGERRWRSHRKFMRRLRSDWNDHGWRRDPIGPHRIGQIDGTSLCNCFFPWSREAVRFKDTPTGRFRKRNERDDWIAAYKEERRLHVERERHGARKGADDARRRWRVVCMSCGYLLGFVWASPSERIRRTKQRFGGFYARCANCEKRSRPA